MTTTFFFSDLEDSTGLAFRLGAQYGSVLARSRDIQRRAIAETGGTEIDCRGDEIFSTFPDPASAAAAALAVQRAFAAETWPQGEPVRVRIGLHFGKAKKPGTGPAGWTSTVRRGSARQPTVGRSSPRTRSRRESRALRGRWASSSFGDFRSRS